MEDYSTCVHREVCYHKLVNHECPRWCDYFENENLLITAPCAIGATIYIRVRTDKKDPNQFFIKTATVAGLHLKDEVGYRGMRRKEYLVVRTDYGMSYHIDTDKIGTIVFFSKEEAEQGCCNPKEG